MKKNRWILPFLLFVLISLTFSVSLHAEPFIRLNITNKTLYAGADRLDYRRVFLVPTLNDVSGTVRYRSSNPEVVKVTRSGRACAVSSGRAVVTAYVRSGGRIYSADCKITVKKPFIRFSEKKLLIKVGETRKVEVTVTPRSTMKWSVYHPKRARIYRNGKVKGLKAGVAYITAEANGVKRKLRVEISNPEPSSDMPDDQTPSGSDGRWKLFQYADRSGNQGMFYTLKNLKDGTLIVVDGGWPENEDYVREILKKNGNVVDAWFLTHYHGDHVSAFNAIYQDPQGVKIRKIYASPLDWDTFAQVYREWDTPESFLSFLNHVQRKDITYLKAGDRFFIKNLEVKVFHSYDKNLKQYYGDDIPNNASLVFKISGKRDSILFCGDAHQSPLADYLIDRWKNQLQAVYVQPGHHGNHSFPNRFYQVVSAKTALFDAPQWLMTGQNYTAYKLKNYFEKKGTVVKDYTTAPNAFLLR